MLSKGGSFAAIRPAQTDSRTMQSGNRFDSRPNNNCVPSRTRRQRVHPIAPAAGYVSTCFR